ncbi:MAG: hypothetical protein COC01_08380 [Bacteroidetes bacterium]|nr:MAG: hypothetical protein COC01_08380 [Bacteroidota bacterium]
MKNRVLVFCLVFICNSSYAQFNCNTAFNDALKYYEEARYDTVIRILNKVLFLCNSKKDVKSNVLKYLSDSYYQIDDITKGNHFLKEFYSENPLYKVNATSDPELFIGYFKKYHTDSKIRSGLSLGLINVIIGRVTRTYDFDNSILYDNSINQIQHWKITLRGQRYFYNKFSGNLDVDFGIYSFSSAEYKVDSLTYKFSEGKIFFRESLYLGYTVQVGKYFLTPTLGLYLAYNPEKWMWAEMQINNENSSVTEIIDIPSISDKHRTWQNYGGLIGLEAEFHQPKFIFFINSAYKHDFRNNVKTYNRLSIPELYYTDNDIFLGYLNFNLGVKLINTVKLTRK